MSQYESSHYVERKCLSGPDSTIEQSASKRRVKDSSIILALFFRVIITCFFFSPCDKHQTIKLKILQGANMGQTRKPMSPRKPMNPQVLP
jgi:hypothetical protein